MRKADKVAHKGNILLSGRSLPEHFSGTYSGSYTSAKGLPITFRTLEGRKEEQAGGYVEYLLLNVC